VLLNTITLILVAEENRFFFVWRIMVFTQQILPSQNSIQLTASIQWLYIVYVQVVIHLCNSVRSWMWIYPCFFLVGDPNIKRINQFKQNIFACPKNLLVFSRLFWIISSLKIQVSSGGGLGSHYGSCKDIITEILIDTFMILKYFL
jgi:hypothetical protein